MSELDARLQEIIKYAYENATAVKNRFDQIGIAPADVKSVADLAKIPIFPKDKIVQLQQAAPPFGGMLTIPHSNVSHICFSPGPCSEPAREPDEST